MLPTEIALVGCHNGTELLGRVTTHPAISGDTITAGLVEAMVGISAIQAYPILEAELPVRFVDVLDNMSDEWFAVPIRSATVTFQSRLNERAKCTFYNVSRETFNTLAADMIDSTIWYLDNVEEN